MGADLAERESRVVLVGAYLVGPLLVVLATLEMLPSWRPTGDLAVVAVRTRDVFSGYVPLFGMHSSLHEETFHPGPLQFWFGALFDIGIGGHGATLIATAVVHVLAIIFVVSVGRTLGGSRGAAVAAVACFAIGWSLYPTHIVEPLNPNAGVFTFAAVFATTLLVVVRPELRWPLPVAVVTASYAAQTHFVFAVATVAIVVPLAVIAVIRMRRRGEWPASLRLSALLALILWSGPILDLLTHGGGNASSVFDAARENPDEPTLGLRRAASIVAGTLVDPPVFANGDVTGLEIHAGAGTAGLLLAGVMVAALAFTAFRWRRSDLLLSSASIATTALIVTTVFSVAQYPSSRLGAVALHNYLPLWVAAVAMWGLLAAIGVRLVGGLVRRSADRRDLAGWQAFTNWAPTALMLAALATLPFLPVRDEVLATSNGPAIDYVAALAPQVEQRLDRDTTYRFTIGLGLNGAAIDTGMIYALLDAGFDVRVGDPSGPKEWYGHHPTTDAPLPTLTLVIGDRRIRDGTVVASFVPPEDLVEARDAAVAELVELVSAAPPLVGSYAEGLTDATAIEEFVRYDLAALVADTSIGGPIAELEATQRLVDLRREPTEPMRVVLTEA